MYTIPNFTKKRPRVDFASFVDPYRDRPRTSHGRFSTPHKSSPRTPRPLLTRASNTTNKANDKTPKNQVDFDSAKYDVTVYQFVDGNQNLITTLPQALMYHHVSCRNLRLLSSRLKAGQASGFSGFNCFSPRYLYRTLYNLCDIQNRSLRQVGCMRNYSKRFEVTFLQYLVDLTIDNAHRVYSIHTGKDSVTTAEFRDRVIDKAYKYFFRTTPGAQNHKVQEGVGIVEELKRLNRVNMAMLEEKTIKKFRKSIAGSDHGRWGGVIADFECLSCKDCKPTTGCTKCAENLPGQIFCTWCWGEHYRAFHQIRYSDLDKS